MSHLQISLCLHGFVFFFSFFLFPFRFLRFVLIPFTWCSE